MVREDLTKEVSMFCLKSLVFFVCISMSFDKFIRLCDPHSQNTEQSHNLPKFSAVP